MLLQYSSDVLRIGTSVGFPARVSRITHVSFVWLALQEERRSQRMEHTPPRKVYILQLDQNCTLKWNWLSLDQGCWYSDMTATEVK
jgi:hypothetical protein